MSPRCICTNDTAIERVFDSYGVKDRYGQLLIQPMLKEVKNSGMLFTDPITGAPYNTLSWSDAGDTDSVTKGKKAQNRLSLFQLRYKLRLTHG